MERIKLNIIGDPVEHSKSPIVHGRVLSALGVDYEYEKVHVLRGELGDYVKSAVENGITGFNLTMPHKTDIIPYLADIDEDARLFGAVNTVRIKNGKLYGYNTDAQGYVLSLKQNGIDVRGRNIVILGAGGVVSTLALKLSFMGASDIILLNRTPDKARHICESIKNMNESGKIKTDTRLVYDKNDADTVVGYAAKCDVIINATPLGMTGIENDYTDLSFLDALKEDAFVSDLIYSPPETSFLRYAKERGHRTMNGLGMLIGQAILADEIYLDKKLDVGALFTNLTNTDCVF